MNALGIPLIQDDLCDTFNELLQQTIGEIACLSLVPMSLAMRGQHWIAISGGRIELNDAGRLPLSPKMVWNLSSSRLRLIGYSSAGQQIGK